MENKLQVYHWNCYAYKHSTLILGCSLSIKLVSVIVSDQRLFSLTKLPSSECVVLEGCSFDSWSFVKKGIETDVYKLGVNKNQADNPPSVKQTLVVEIASNTVSRMRLLELFEADTCNNIVVTKVMDTIIAAAILNQRNKGAPAITSDGRWSSFLVGLLWLSILLSKSFILFPDLVELIHVLLEMFTSLECDEKFCFLAVTLGALNCNGFSSNFFELGVIVSNQIFWSNHAGWDCVAKSMKLDCIMSLKVLFAQENIEIWVLFNWNVNLIRVLWTIIVSWRFFHFRNLSITAVHTLFL